MRKKLVLSVLAILIFNIIFIPTISGSTESGAFTCYPTDDSYVSQQQRYENYGSEKLLKVRTRYGGSSPYWEKSILIKFDLSSLPLNIYIVSALLYMDYYDYIDGDPYSRVLSTYRLNSEWSENDVTWSNRPRNAGYITANSTVPESFDWMYWNLTRDIQDYVDSLWVNYGWQIVDKDAWGEVNIPTAVFYSKDKGNNKPYLEIEYTAVKPNIPPTADTGGPYTSYVNQTINFNASNSNDTDGYIVGYRWDFNNNGTYDTDWLTTPNATYIYNVTGIYNVTLQVKDNEDATATNTTVVNISNKPPYANFTYSPKYPIQSDIMSFNDTSYDDNGEVVSWWWDFGDNYFSDLQNPTHQYNSTGVYIVNLTVVDNDGENGSIEIEVNVSEYRCGDVDDDGEVKVSDAISLIRYLILRRNIPEPYCRADVNGDGRINIFDFIYLVKYLVFPKISSLIPTCCG